MQQHHGLQTLGCAVSHNPTTVPCTKGEPSLLKQEKSLFTAALSFKGRLVISYRKGSLLLFYLVHLPVVLLILRRILRYL